MLLTILVVVVIEAVLLGVAFQAGVKHAEWAREKEQAVKKVF